jgi:DNA topoisomerase-3
MGRPFAAIIKMSPPEFKPEFDIGQQNGEGEKGEPNDFTGQTPVGKCPACGSNV